MHDAVDDDVRGVDELAAEVEFVLAALDDVPEEVDGLVGEAD